MVKLIKKFKPENSKRILELIKKDVRSKNLIIYYGVDLVDIKEQGGLDSDQLNLILECTEVRYDILLSLKRVVDFLISRTDVNSVNLLSQIIFNNLSYILDLKYKPEFSEIFFYIVFQLNLSG